MIFYDPSTHLTYGINRMGKRIDKFITKFNENDEHGYETIIEATNNMMYIIQNPTDEKEDKDNDFLLFNKDDLPKLKKAIEKYESNN